MENKPTPQQALDFIANVIMERVQGTGKEHAQINIALNILHELVKEKEQK
jgi:hypothetical protein